MNGPENSPERHGAEPRRNDGLAALESRLAEEAQELRLGGHQAFFLEPAETAWWVVEGRIELFALTAPDDERPGRIHVATFSARQMLFSPLTLQRRSAPEVAGEAPPRRFLAAPTPGTRLLRLTVAGLKRLARDEALVPALARSIETWLEKLGSELEKERPPKLFQELEAGKELTLEEPGTVARSRRGLVWVRHVAGSSEFLGRPELPMHRRSFLLPISEHTWLVSREATRLSAVSTDLLLRGGTLWEGLERFHRLVLAQIDIAFEQRHEDDKARFERQAELDHKTLQGAYARLSSILGTALDAAPIAAGEVDDPLLSACRLIGRAQGFEVELPPGGPPSGTVQRRLNRLCAASRVRSRRTILRDDWWRRDNGPLLAFLSAAETSEAVRPVALLPTSPRSYRLVDPAGSSRPVDAAVAEELEGEAFMFYPPLPERPLVLRDLLRAALRDQRFDLRTIVMMGLAGGLLGTLTPILTGVIFGQVVPNANRPLLFQMTLALVLSAFAGAAFQITRSIAVLRLSGKIDGSLQAAIWDRLLSLPTRFFRNFTVGDLTNRAMGADAIRELLTGHVTTSLLVSFFSVFSFALLFYYSWVLALIATLIVAILGTVSIGFALLQLKHQRKLLAMQGKISSLLFGLIHGIAKLRISGAEPRAFALWAEQFTEQRRETWASRRIANLQGAVNAAYPLLSIGGIFAMVGFSAQVGLSVSDFLAFNVAFGQFQAAFLSILGLIPSVLSVVPIYERLTPILETAPEVDPSKADAGELAGDIEFSHISFRYKADGPLILDDVSFRVRPGEFIALVGPSGSGKSTCLRLLLGFEQPSSGSIYFDGQDLPSLDMPSVRQQIGVVLQNGRPLVGDIFSNIVGSRNLGIDEAWEAARMAGLDDDIKSMPMGMHTIISEGGGTFSGGQQQRLMIARAIVHRPRILLFDEATSALDNRTQDIVSRSLESLKASRIVVAHRLSTILNADRIYVIEKGRVVDSGTYEELIARGGLFSRLAQRQIA